MVSEYLAHAGYERYAPAAKVQIKERYRKKSSWRPWARTCARTSRRG